MAAGSVAIAYAVLLALGLVPPTAIAAAAAFALIGVTLFVLAWGDPQWAPAPAPRRTPAPAGGSPGARHGRAIPAPHRSAGPGPVGRPAVAAPHPAALARAATPGEIVWSRLTREPSGVLPVDLVPPTAESPFEALPGESYDLPEEGPGAWPGSSIAAPYGLAWTGTASAPESDLDPRRARGVPPDAAASSAHPSAVEGDPPAAHAAGPGEGRVDRRVRQLPSWPYESAGLAVVHRLPPPVLRGVRLPAPPEPGAGSVHALPYPDGDRGAPVHRLSGDSGVPTVLAVGGRRAPALLISARRSPPHPQDR